MHTGDYQFCFKDMDIFLLYDLLLSRKKIGGIISFVPTHDKKSLSAECMQVHGHLSKSDGNLTISKVRILKTVICFMQNNRLCATLSIHALVLKLLKLCS